MWGGRGVGRGGGCMWGEVIVIGDCKVESGLSWQEWDGVGVVWSRVGLNEKGTGLGVGVCEG